MRGTVVTGGEGELFQHKCAKGREELFLFDKDMGQLPQCERGKGIVVHGEWKGMNSSNMSERRAVKNCSCLKRTRGDCPSVRVVFIVGTYSV